MFRKFIAALAACLIAAPAFAGAVNPPTIVPTLRNAIQSLAANAAAGNLLTNPISASAATITSPGSAASTTGLTDLLPGTNGFGGTITGTTVAGSSVVTSTSAVSGGATSTWQVGGYLAETGTNDAYPTHVTPGSQIVSVNAGANTLTMSKPALLSGSAVPIGYFPASIKIVGGYAGNYGSTFSPASGTRTSASPAQSYVPFALEFMTDAANFSTATPAIVMTIVGNQTPLAYRVAVDDVYQTANYVLINTGSNQITIQFATAGVHKVRIEQTAGVRVSHLYLTTNAKIWQPPKNGYSVNAAMFADSFFNSGYTGSWGMHNIANQVCILLGWNCFAPAVNGTGYIATGGTSYAWTDARRIADITRIPPDVIVLFGSVNDSGQTSNAEQTAAASVYSQIRAIYPTIPIFVFGVPNTKTVSTSAATLETGIAAAVAASQAAGDNNIWFFPITNDPAGAWITKDVTTDFAGGGYTSYCAASSATISGATLTINTMTTGTVLPYSTVTLTGGATGVVQPYGTSSTTGTGQTGTYALTGNSGSGTAVATTACGDSTHPADNFGNANGPEYYAKRMKALILSVVSSLDQ